MQYRLRLSFLEAVHGVEKDLNFQFQTAVNGRAKVETREKARMGGQRGVTRDADLSVPSTEGSLELSKDKKPSMHLATGPAWL